MAIPVTENNLIKLWFEKGILCCQYKINKLISLEEAKAIVDLRVSFSNMRHYPVLIDVKNLNTISKEVREYFSFEESCKLISAGALLIYNPVQKVIANGFLFFNKAPFPTRVFTDAEGAKAWLEQYT